MECDVKLIAHHLAKGGTCALATVGLSDIEGGRAVLADDDPRVELMKVGIGDTDQSAEPQGLDSRPT